MKDIKIKHFVLTRFNIPLWKMDKFNRPTLTSEWLEDRFQLFDKYCFPSMKAQTNGEFIWICLFDDQTPQKFKDRINGYKSQFPQFYPCFLNEDESLSYLSYIQTKIQQFTSKDITHIITTRIDNDDAFHKDMIDLIQQKVLDFDSNENDVVLTPCRGLQYFEKHNLAVCLYFPNNHFLTRVERAESAVKTILEYNHFKIFELHHNIKEIDRKNLWIEVIHGSNVDNDIKMTLKIKPILRNISLVDYGSNILLNSKQSTKAFVDFYLKRATKLLVSKVGKKIGR